MFKEWLIKVFFGKSMLLTTILMELQGIHYHLDRMEVFYMAVNKIKEDDKEIKIGDIIIKKERGEDNGLSK